MTKRKSVKDVEKRSRARQQTAMDRNELRQNTTNRETAAGVTSMAVKTVDPNLRKLIDEALRRR